MRLWYDFEWIKYRARIFIDRRERTTGSKENRSSRLKAISLDNPIPWLRAVKKKRKLFQGYAPMSPRLFVLPHRIHCKLEEY